MSNSTPVRKTGTTHCVAIDLGSHFIRVVEIERSDTDVRILRRGMAALPANAWNDLKLNREIIASGLREAISSAGITAKAVVACLPRRLVTVRFAGLPQSSPEQLRGMIEFEAQQYILFPLDEVTLDYRVLSDAAGLPGGEDLQTVLLAAARRSLILDIMAIFDRAGLELLQLSVSALALAENIKDSIDPTAIIDLEPGAMDVAVVSEGQLLFTRSSLLDIQGVQTEIAARKLSEEVARSFTAYQNEFRQKPLSHVYLSGASTVREGDWIEQAMMEVLEMPVSRLTTRTITTADVEARAYTVAIGMALQATGQSIAGVNLVPNERAVRKANQQKQIRNVLYAAACLALLVPLVLFIRNWSIQQDKTRADTVDANQKLQTEMTRHSKIQKTHDHLADLASVLDKGLDRQHPSVDMLVALNESLPSSTQIWFTQMSFERSALLTLRGEAKNASDVTDLVINLQKSGSFTDVKIGYLGDAQDTSQPDSASAAPVTTPVIKATSGAAPITGGAAAIGGGTSVPGLPGMNASPGNPGAVNPAGGNPGRGNGPGGNPGNPNFRGSNPGGFVPGGAPGVGNPGAGNFGGRNSGRVGSRGSTNTIALSSFNPQPGGQPPPSEPQPPIFIPSAPPGGGGLAQPPTAGPPPGTFPVDPSKNIVITPNMMNGRSGPGRNRVTNGAADPSIPMGSAAVPITGRGSVPGGPILQGGTTPTQTPVMKSKISALPSKPVKAVLTSFVVTCRLKPNGVLIHQNKSGSHGAHSGRTNRNNRQSGSSTDDSSSTDDTGDETDAQQP